MSAIARYRLLSTILKNNRRLYSEIAANPSREPIISASSVVNDHQPPQHPSSSGTEKKSWGFLKYSLVAALTGGVATAGYATYGSFPLRNVLIFFCRTVFCIGLGRSCRSYLFHVCWCSLERIFVGTIIFTLLFPPNTLLSLVFVNRNENTTFI